MVPLSHVSEPENTAQDEDGPRPRVLVVDDSRDSAEMLCEVLQAYGCSTCVAYDGPSALDAAQSFKPHLALIDINLPLMDGYEVAQRMRQNPELRQIRLIAVTGYSEAAERRRSQQAGFNDHMVKPIDLKQLRDAIRG